MIDVVDAIIRSDCLIQPNTWAAIAQAAEGASAAGQDRPDLGAIREAARKHRASIDACAAAFAFVRCAVGGDFIDLLAEPDARDVPTCHDGEQWWALLFALGLAGDRYDLLARVRMPVPMYARQKRAAIKAIENAMDRAKGTNEYAKFTKLSERLERERVALASAEGEVFA